MLRSAINALGIVLGLALLGLPQARVQAASPILNAEQDEYTRYELLDPGSAKFRIIYEVTASTPGATVFFNPIRKGSVATDERVSDRASGKPLRFSVVSGAQAKAEELADADVTIDYIRVELARPVPANGGQARILIEKTYEDPKSYSVSQRLQSGDVILPVPMEIAFARSLGIKRNAVVLPLGWELIDCNYPSQVLQEADGRIAISFWNSTPAEAPLVLHARRTGSVSGAGVAVGPSPLVGGPSSQAAKLQERAHQTRDIVYFLQPPQTHAFALYHDYTESRPGVSRYVNVVRDGSHVTDPSARNLDTGETLVFEVIRGPDIEKAGLDADERPAKITPQSEVVVFRYAPVPPGGSTRLRMSETYTDAESYKLVGDELVFFRTFGRAHNAVVLPDGWALTNSSIPATVSRTQDGRTRLDFTNARPDEIAVLITARRRNVP
jgi:hypothetical protein